MICIRSTALPAAVTLVLFAGACQDAPTSPRSPSAPAIASTSEIRSSGVRVYTGRRADSIANEILGAWSLIGHPEYLARRQTSRAGLHLAPETMSSSIRPGAAPAHILLDGGESGGTYKDPAKIAEHHENFYFGHSTDIPSLLNASMNFVGDYGRIDAAVTVTSKAGTVPLTATIGEGSGQLINCTDLLSSCGNSKFMEGSLVFNNAPYCDAYASGTVTFTAQNRDLLGGSLSYAPLTSGGSMTYLPAVAVAPISSSSAACTQTGDNGGAGVPGDGGDAPPTPPAPEPAPPAYPPSAPVDFHCETTEWWKAGVLELITTQCYPD